MEGKSTRPGVYKCRECEKPFSVTVGTVFESSHVPLNKWLYATHKLNSGKKGTSRISCTANLACRTRLLGLWHIVSAKP